MALPGMKSTADFEADRRPKNWRDGLLRLSPRNNAPLFALTAAMKSEKTDDPEFIWWEKDVELYTYKLGAAAAAGITTLTLDVADATMGKGTTLKPGDTLRNQRTGEVVRVAVVTSNTAVEVQRAVGEPTSPAGTASAFNTADVLLYIGSAYREGAPKSLGTSTGGIKRSNFTQIFRTPIEITRTADQTRLRGMQGYAELKEDAMHKHSLGIERAFWLGTKWETLENSQPLRFTGGIINSIPTQNRHNFTVAGTDMDELEAIIGKLFAYGSNEKVVWGSIASMMVINSIVRKNSSYQWAPKEKEYGMDVKRLFTPAGTLTFMEHPLFGQAGQWMEKDLVVMDTANLRYRHLQDTVLLKDRQQPGDDGKCDEYLTEAGLELHHGRTFHLLQGLTKAIKDD